MFIDEVTIKVIAGAGGDGCTAFRRVKYIEMGGPFGGNGGHGGNIIFEVDEGLNTLSDFRHMRKYCARDGEEGGEYTDIEIRNIHSPVKLIF